MKKLVLAIIFLITANGLFNSCTSLLDEEPVDRYVVGNFYSNSSDAEAAIAAVYQTLYSIYNRDIFMLTETSVDIIKNGIGMSNPDMQNIEYLRLTSENQFIINNWSTNYTGIARANTAIANIPNITMDVTLKNRLIAEATFMRALFYFNLVRLFGDVPLVLKLESLDDAFGEKTPKDQVYQQIIEDLKFVENSLPISYPSSETGRATQGAAKILLGKVYLTIHEYQNCVSKLAEVVEHEDIYEYGLHDNYGDNWKVDTENGKEMVFSIEHMAPPGTNNPLMNIMGPKYSLPGGFAAIGLNNSNESFIPTMDLYTSFLDEDERKDVTMRTDFISLIDGSLHICSIPIFVKYFEENQRITSHCGVNKHILRYADALLMYAEALNEVSQTTKALDYLNRVRERAFHSTDFNYAGLSEEEFRTAVGEERKLELAIEGHRWFDLVRTGKLVETMKAHSAREALLAESNKVEIAQNIKDYMVLYPIPQHELDLNDKLIQNTGY